MIDLFLENKDFKAVKSAGFEFNRDRFWAFLLPDNNGYGEKQMQIIAFLGKQLIVAGNRFPGNAHPVFAANRAGIEVVARRRIGVFPPDELHFFITDVLQFQTIRRVQRLSGDCFAGFR